MAIDKDLISRLDAQVFYHMEQIDRLKTEIRLHKKYNCEHEYIYITIMGDDTWLCKHCKRSR